MIDPITALAGIQSAISMVKKAAKVANDLGSLAPMIGKMFDANFISPPASQADDQQIHDSYAENPIDIQESDNIVKEEGIHNESPKKPIDRKNVNNGIKAEFPTPKSTEKEGNTVQKDKSAISFSISE